MASNGNPSLPQQKSMTSGIKKLDINPSSRHSLTAKKPSNPSQKTPQVTMLRKVTIAVLKAENPQMAHLFGSNYGPSDSELQIIHQNLKAVKAEQLKYRRMEPPGRYSYGQQLETRIFMHNMQQIDATIVHWRSLLAPIRRIPPEILCHVFSYVVPFEVPSKQWGRRPRVDAPFFLLHVCRLWRRLASSTSSLWRRLPDVSLRGVKPDLVEGRLALLLKCVDLAKKDISVYIKGPRFELDPFWNTEWASDRDHLQPLINFLCRTSHLWTECTVSTTGASPNCLTGVKGNTPNLRKLTLFFGNADSTYNMHLFEQAPLLQTLHLAGPHDGHIAVPMHQLSNLKDHSLGELASHRLFQSPNYPNLVYLELTDRRMESSTTLRFPRLQHFQITCQIDMEMGCMPRALFPSLLKLVVFANGDAGDILGVVTRAIIRSNCTAMESLSVYCTYIPPLTAENHPRTRLSSLLAVTPNLSQLDMFANATDIRDLANFYSQGSLAAPRCNIYVSSPIRRDTATAFQQFGESWRHLSGNGSHKHTIKICPYKSAPLCDPPQRPMVTPAMLECWFSDSKGTILHDLSIKLRATYPVQQVCALQCQRVHLGTVQVRQELSDILSKVELHSPKSVNEILNSNIHFVMARLTVHSIHDVYWPAEPACNRLSYSGKSVYLHRFREQLLRIMKKWHKILMKESLDNIHWIWSTTANELDFVPAGASARGDKTRWASIILGMPELHTVA